MRRREISGMAVWVALGFGGLFQSEWVLGLALTVVGLSFYALGVKNLKKQGCPKWCSSNPSVLGRRRFHRFDKSGETDDGWNILECSRCGASRTAPKRTSY